MSGYPGQGYPGSGYGGDNQQQAYGYQQQGGYQQQQGGYDQGAYQQGQYQGGYPQQPQYNREQQHGYGGQAPPPPQGMVSFGHGAPDSYAFQYSNCTGRRKALLIGINYFGQSGELRGCVNDVGNVSRYLNENFGYAREDMVMLTDDQQDPMGQPTKNNILRAMNWLVRGVQPNDSLFFHYSGHGGQTQDTSGDEEDGNDEVIYPVDYKQAGHIVDDEMHSIMVSPLQPGVRLTAIFDSCHSGSALDLPYIYSTQGVLKEPNLAKEAGQGLLGVISSASQGDYGKVAGHLMGFFKKATDGDEAYEKTVATKTSPADVVMWSGSKDDQTSADATIASQATGAMSWAFISAMKANPKQSYVQLLNSIREVLATKYTQKPQLSCSHPLDTNLLFIM
ncbi:probable Metacaspase-1A [Rhynchosporium agropyri]|uniref:Probable Metacaspase-1A n=1 Tax=Rhynchosporium agropyri TaxID=914238 RepID=A0A1E1LQV6_9HELO|nr:probable Metacaspase-1A [Rhynchosporium agropyri]